MSQGATRKKSLGTTALDLYHTHRDKEYADITSNTKSIPGCLPVNMLYTCAVPHRGVSRIRLHPDTRAYT